MQQERTGRSHLNKNDKPNNCPSMGEAHRLSTQRIHSIRETARLTGVASDTLRKWEERYGILTPTRLPNGYRGYTVQDIALIRWLQRQIAGGARISLVAEDARNRLEAGWNPESDPVAKVDQPAAQLRPMLEIWREELLNGLIETQTDSARRSMETLFSLYEVETVLTEVLGPVMQQIGQLWESGAISEYQEHFSSVIVRDRLSSIRAQQRPGSGPSLITACLPGELHEIGILMLSILALRRGFRVTHLSGSPAPQGLCRAITELRPDAVCLSVATGEAFVAGLKHLGAIAAAAKSIKPTPLVLVGGRAIALTDSLPKVSGITFVTLSAEQTIDLLESELKFTLGR